MDFDDSGLGIPGCTIAVMDIRGWEERYRERGIEDAGARANPLLVETIGHSRPGRVLDLACGAGRNAIWMARRGWEVTAVDGATTAVEILRTRAVAAGVTIDARVADLQKGEFEIGTECWDLVTICFYLQRDLFEPAKRSVVAGGLLLAIVHTTNPGEEPTQSRLRPGELRKYFEDWTILHEYEGASKDAAHHRPVAEIVARRPG